MLGKRHYGKYNDRVGGRRLRVLRRSTGEVGMSRGGETIRSSSASVGELSFIGVSRIGERSGDAARMYVGKRSSATGRRTGMGKVFTRCRIWSM